MADSAATSLGGTGGPLSELDTGADATDTLIAGAVETCCFPLSALNQPTCMRPVLRRHTSGRRKLAQFRQRIAQIEVAFRAIDTCKRVDSLVVASGTAGSPPRHIGSVKRSAALA